MALDAPVAEYVPEFSPASADLAKRITVRQLIAHSSGLLARWRSSFYYNRFVSETACRDARCVNRGARTSSL